MTLTHHIVPVPQLDADAMERMFLLMRQYYGNVRREVFIRDLARKHGVLLVFDRDRRICGFTTYALYDRACDGRFVSVLYSGDTVIDDRYWGSLSVTRLFTALLDDCLRHSAHDLYWFLLSKGVRTYQLLPLYFREFYPCYDRPTPRAAGELIHALARQQFGDRYDEAGGIVRFGTDGDYLRPDFDRPLKTADHCHARYFLSINPGYRRGDNVPCLARISPANFQPIVSRWLRTIDQYELSQTHS